MEGAGLKATTAILMMVMLTFHAHAHAQNVVPTDNVHPEGFKFCYAMCMGFCLIRQNSLVGKGLKCAGKCLMKCAFKPSDNDRNDIAALVLNHYCSLGCSLQQCLKPDLIHDANKVEGCMGDCSNNSCN